MNLRQAAQRALKAMEDGEWRADMVEFSDALIALRAALAEPEQAPMHYYRGDEKGNLKRTDIHFEQPEQEPVAWSGYDLDAMVEAFGRVIEAHHSNNHPFHNPIDSDARMALRILRGFIPAMKAYTAPTPRKPLSESELEALWDKAVDHMEHFCSQYWDFARAIERAHGIGEQT